MRAVLIGIFLVSFGTTANAACHRYSKWYYPWPQKCKATTQAAYEPVARLPVIPPLPPVFDKDKEDIPLPDLTAVGSEEINKELQEELERRRALMLLRQNQ